MSGKHTFVNSKYPRFDLPDKARGETVYGTDLRFADMLTAKILRSPYAHAKIVAIHTEEAKKLPGVVAVLTGKDHPWRIGRVIDDQPFLAIDKVIYAGEPVVAVAAMNEKTAEKALDLIKVEYEQLQPVFDVEESASGNAPVIHEGFADYFFVPPAEYMAGSNICSHKKVRKGDTEKGFAMADFIVENRFYSPMGLACCLEPQVCIAQVASNGSITLWDSTQSVYRVRRALARVLRKKEKDIHIIVPHLGGGFGEKNCINQELVAIGLAMHSGGRPVKVQLNREEQIQAAMTKHACVVYIKSGIKNDGEILARQVTAYYDTGAYAHTGPTVSGQAGFTAAGPYKIENITIDSYCVYTNKTPAGSYRGYGVPQVSWAYEQHMDIIAARLKMDPLAFRLKNVLQNGDETMSGEIVHDCALKECIEKAAAAIDWNAPAPALAPGKLRGKGIAGAWKSTGAPSVHLATIRMEQDGSVVVGNSTTEMGQGCLAVFQAITCDELALLPEDVNVSLPDSIYTPYTEGTTSSRAGAFDGRAVYDAAQKIKQQLFSLAAPLLEVDIEKLELRDKKVMIKGTETGISYGNLLSKSDIGHAGNLFAQGEYRTNYVIKPDPQTGQSPLPTSSWLYAAQAVEVEIDTDSGTVTVLRVASAHDVGIALNVLNCEQQVEGGVLMGISNALYEDLLFDEGGHVRNNSFVDYKLLTVRQVPPIETILIEDMPGSAGVYGAKGLGESSLIAISAAIANAVYDATGIVSTNLPITAERLYWAIKEKEKRE